MSDTSIKPIFERCRLDFKTGKITRETITKEEFEEDTRKYQEALDGKQTDFDSGTRSKAEDS